MRIFRKHFLIQQEFGVWWVYEKKFGFWVHMKGRLAKAFSSCWHANSAIASEYCNPKDTAVIIRHRR